MSRITLVIAQVEWVVMHLSPSNTLNNMLRVIRLQPEQVADVFHPAIAEKLYGVVPVGLAGGLLVLAVCKGLYDYIRHQPYLWLAWVYRVA